MSDIEFYKLWTDIVCSHENHFSPVWLFGIFILLFPIFFKFYYVSFYDCMNRIFLLLVSLLTDAIALVFIYTIIYDGYISTQYTISMYENDMKSISINHPISQKQLQLSKTTMINCLNAQHYEGKCSTKLLRKILEEDYTKFRIENQIDKLNTVQLTKQ